MFHQWLQHIGGIRALQILEWCHQGAVWSGGRSNTGISYPSRHLWLSVPARIQSLFQLQTNEKSCGTLQGSHTTTEQWRLSYEVQWGSESWPLEFDQIIKCCLWHAKVSLPLIIIKMFYRRPKTVSSISDPHWASGWSTTVKTSHGGGNEGLPPLLLTPATLWHFWHKSHPSPLHQCLKVIQSALSLKERLQWNVSTNDQRNIVTELHAASCLLVCTWYCSLFFWHICDRARRQWCTM